MTPRPEKHEDYTELEQTSSYNYKWNSSDFKTLIPHTNCDAEITLRN